MAIRLTFVGAMESASKIQMIVCACFNSSNRPVFTMVNGVPLLVNGILITGTFATVIGFDVVIIVILAGGSCGGVVFMTGSIFTHLAPVDAVPP